MHTPHANWHDLEDSILNIIIVTQNQGAGLKGVFDNLSSE